MKVADVLFTHFKTMGGPLCLDIIYFSY